MIPKFRGKTIDGSWVFGSLVKFDENTCFIMKERKGASVFSYAEIFALNSFYVVSESVSQSTGLKDKNGVEIFEGDIVQYRDGEYSYLGIVKRDCYQFFIDGIEPDDNYDFIDVSNTFDGTSSLEVIGNIHENPELLEVK